MFTRRAFILFGIIQPRPNKLKPVRTNTNYTVKSTNEINDKRFRYKSVVFSDEQETAYFVQEQINWYDPVTNEEKSTFGTNCYIVDSQEL